MKLIYNVLGYQMVWFAAVAGAGRELWWAGPLAALVFAAGHFGWAANASDRGRDLRLMALALACGLILDGSLAYTGLVVYGGGGFALPPGGAPPWILSLWMAFALTLGHSLAAASRRPLLCATLGAIFGPLAYLGAERGFAAAVLPDPRWQSLTALAIGWAFALWVLARFTGRGTGPRRDISADSAQSPA
jgi:Protein of unknown function (DUF2878)